MTAKMPAFDILSVPRIGILLTRIAMMILCACLTATAARAQDDSLSDPDAAARPLQVWLPAPLISDVSGVAFQLLDNHTQVFAENNNIGVQYRIKNVDATGGIMSSIRAGTEVAPGALPDLTLIRRRDFTPTQARQYMHSMETLFSSSLISDLGNALEFGQIPLDGGMALYGLPYFFELLLAVYTQPLTNDKSSISFDDVLASRAIMLFPAARATGLNQTFYLQYLVAGGARSRDGEMAINDTALLTVLEFYERLVQEGLVTADVLTYQSPAEYQTEFINHASRRQIAVFSSSDFLSMLDQQNANLRATNIPTASGDKLATRDGWLWVIITPDRARQTISARFLEWMTEPEFHAEFAQLLYQLPTQPAILGASLPDAVDHQFFEDLLVEGILPLPESEGGTAPRIMQEALIRVLNGEDSAADATDQVLNQFGGR